ncbi:MAG: hypothetical protein IPP19_05530 [Verrucomicrobia bacterium]|nr:hypothetical protein [Verrucomicrobiota bacterium]
MKNFWLKAVPVLVCLLISSGCSSAPPLGAMMVYITDLRPDASGSSAELALRYSNENVFPLAVQTTSGSLYLNNTYVGKFEHKVAVGLTQLGSASSKATLVVEKPAEFQAIVKATTTSPIAYRLASTLRLEIGEDKVTVKSESTGQIDRAQMIAEPAK